MFPQLVKFNIASHENKTVSIFHEICPDIFRDSERKPSEFIQSLWTSYQSIGKQDNSINGKMFEYLVASVLLRKNIVPFNQEAQLAYIPNVKYDILLLASTRQLISLSLKTSARERYKQADLEAMALKNVHRRAKNYLILLNAPDVQNLKKKIQEGEVLALDDVILANGPDFDRLIEDLCKLTFIPNENIPLIKTSNLVNEPV